MPAERWSLKAFFAAAFLLLIAAAAPACAGSAAPTRLEGAAALRPFFAALAAIDDHRTRRMVRILQIGDSHTANDGFSGRLRERLQARFGAAGRGWLPAGIPYKYYRPALVTVAESGWRHIRPRDGDPAARFGLDGVVAEAAAPDARMGLTSIEAGGFDRIAIEFVARPRGRPLTLSVDHGRRRSIATVARRVAVRRFETLLPREAHAVELAATSSGQQVLGWSVERRGAGIIYENHGSVGATISLLSRLTPSAVRFELATRRPALLVVAFGTNSAFKNALDLGAYAAEFRGAVAALRRQARGAAVLIIGPPDGNRLPPHCLAPAASSAPCGSHEACSWAEPRYLAAVRDIQRHIASRQGWAFWDWAAAMGGRCSIDRWLGRDPPLAMPDHVHLSKAGYAAAADVLFGDLMEAYDGWRRR